MKATFPCVSVLILILGVFAGIALIIIGRKKVNETSREYVCGDPPPTSDMVSRKVPFCIFVASEQNYGTFPPMPDRPLCLHRENPDDPPAWCCEDVADTDPDSYWLWWSPCDKCGTARRLFKDRKNDESWFKLPTSPKPNLPVVPPSGSEVGWLRWDNPGSSGKWVYGSVLVSACGNSSNDTTDVSASLCSDVGNIPPECYANVMIIQYEVRIIWCGIICMIVCCGCVSLTFGDSSSDRRYGGFDGGGWGGGGGGGGGGGC